MLVTVQTKTNLNFVSLPDDRHGARWLVDAQGVRIAFAEAGESGWSIIPAEGFGLCSQEGTRSEETLIVPFDKIAIFALSDSAGEWTVICRPSTGGDKTSKVIGFTRDVEISIGRAADNAVCYGSQFVSSHHARLSLRDGVFSVSDLSSANGVYVNGERLDPNIPFELSHGDVVVILGLLITVGDRFISLNNPQNMVKIQEHDCFVEFRGGAEEHDRHGAKAKRQYFYPALRFARSIERKEFVVDAPPQREQEDDTPIAMRIGPSLVMAMASILSASVSVMFVLEQGSSMMRAIPMVAMAVAMLAGSVLWPVLNKRYQCKKHVQKESQRRGAYSQYLGKVRSELLQETRVQEEILNENRIAVRACMRHAKEADERFMNRIPMHKDYLELRIGCGEEPLQADIRFPDSHFNVVEDDLRDVVDAFSQEPHVLKNVPLGYSLIERPVLGVVGTRQDTNAFVRGLVIQIAALHAYSDVKIVVLCDESDEAEWRFASYLPHCFDDEKGARFFAASLEAANTLGMSLARTLEMRRSADRGFDAREAKPYYVIICSSKDIYDKAEIVRDVLELKDNLGFSFIGCAEKMHQLPR